MTISTKGISIATHVKEYGPTDNPQTQPARKHVSKSSACRMVQHSHKWISHRVIQELSPQEFAARRVQCFQAINFMRHILVKLPPVELPGLRFVEPQSFAWQAEHRNADRALSALV